LYVLVVVYPPWGCPQVIVGGAATTSLITVVVFLAWLPTTP
jgi:hypothetical protein